MLGMLNAFAIWWRDELLSFVPRRLRNLRARSNDALVIALEENGAVFRSVRGAIITELAKFPLVSTDGTAQRAAVGKIIARQIRERTTTIVSLPAHWVLSRTLTLPAIAEDNLQRAASYQIERCTPFTAEEVYYGAEIASRDKEAKQINVVMQIVARSMVDGALEALKGLGLQPSRLCAAEDEISASHGINLLPPAQHERGSRKWAMATLALGVTAIVLTAAAVWLPLERKRAESILLAERVTFLRTESITARQLETEVGRLTKRIDFIPRQKQLHPPVIRALNDLTELLPDDAWLYQLRLQKTQLEIQGYSKSASGLIELIEGSPTFQDAAFRSIVTRDSKTNLERYHIRFKAAAEVKE